MNEGKGHSGDVKGEWLKGGQGNLFKFRLNNRPHQITPPKKFLGDRNYDNRPKHPEEDGQNTRHCPQLEGGFVGEGVVTGSRAGHPRIQGDPENDGPKSQKDGVANRNGSGILAAVAGSKPKDQSENQKGTESVEPPSLSFKLLPQKEQSHEEGERSDKRKARTCDQFLHLK